MSRLIKIYKVEDSTFVEETINGKKETVSTNSNRSLKVIPGGVMILADPEEKTLNNFKINLSELEVGNFLAVTPIDLLKEIGAKQLFKYGVGLGKYLERAISDSYDDLPKLYENKPTQKASLIYFVADASGHTLIESGYAYFEYLGTTNEDETDYRIISTEKQSDNKEYKLFCKTSSTASNWFIQALSVASETAFKVIDNGNGATIYEGFFSSAIALTANLATSTGDASVWVDVDENGNNATSFNSWNSQGDITYINYDIFPLLEVVSQYFSATTIVVGKLFNLIYFKSFSANYIGLDFKFTTKLETFKVYGACSLDIEVDLSKNTNLVSYSSNIASSTFDVSNHLLLETLEFLNSAVLDSNINNTLLPNLIHLNLFNKVTTFDVAVNDLSSLTYLKIECDNFLNQQMLTLLESLNLKCFLNVALSFTSLVNLSTLIISDISNVVGILDLKPLVSLTAFQLNYQTHGGITQIDIANGNNALITNFRRYYVVGALLDVKVDNPVLANAGTSPYLPSVWLKQYDGYDVINFI